MEMYVAIRKGGVRHSTDRGATWQDVTGSLAELSPETLARAADGTVLVSAAGAKGGIFRLVKGEWVKGKDSPTGVSMFAVLSDGTVVSYSGTFGSAMCTIYRSADHVIVLGQGHLERLLRKFIEEYYHPARPHQGLDGDTPIPQPKADAPITDPTRLISTPILGGLHHRYRRVAA